MAYVSPPDISCPYCGQGQEINHDDGYGYEEGSLHQQQCGNCHKTFTFTTSISFDYQAYKADCLNGGQHDYHPTRTVPKECTTMRCSLCEGERPLTDDERRQILTPNT